MFISLLFLSICPTVFTFILSISSLKTTITGSSLSLSLSLSLCLGYPSANTKVISIAAYAILKLGPFSKSFGKPGLAVKVTLEPFFWCSNDIRESSKNTKHTWALTPTKASCFSKRYAIRSTYGLYQGTMDFFDGISDVKRCFSLSLSRTQTRTLYKVSLSLSLSPTFVLLL